MINLCIYLLISYLLRAALVDSHNAAGSTERDLMARLESNQLPTLPTGEALEDSCFTEFANQQFPELGNKWDEVRREYNHTLRAIRLLESKRADMLVITSWEGSHINLSTGEAYIRLINRLILKSRLLKEQHGKIEQTIQRCYAEHTVRRIRNDSEIQESIDFLMNTTETILRQTSASSPQ